MTFLKCEHVTKVYKQGETSVYAANGINMTVEPGNFTVITGKSGSGKSTILNICAGMLKPTSGNVYFEDENITLWGYDRLAKYHREQIGMIFQDFDLLPIMTVRENIMLPSILSNRKPDKHHFDELVETLGLTERLEHFPNELSGGQIQRTAIARALINHPKIIFADEPTGNLDSNTACEIVDLLLKINSTGVAVMLITHDSSICSRVLSEASAPVFYHIENGLLSSEGLNNSCNA